MTLKELEHIYGSIKEWSRDGFVTNECGSDEYRECQPAKGLAMIAELFEIYEGGNFTDEAADTLRLVELWLHRMNNPEPNDYSYAGADQLALILELYHDRLWEVKGRHPYDGDKPGDYFDHEVLRWYCQDARSKARGN